MANIQDVSVGFKKESVFGTPVTVDRWLEFTDESLDYKWEPKQGGGLRVGSGVALGSKRSHPTGQGSGDFTVPLTSKGMGTLLELALGTSGSTLVSGTTYQQNHTINTASLMPSATIQKGIVDAGGTVHPYTFAGCVCSGFEIAVPQNDIATLKTSWDIRSLATATAYTSPSYPSGGVQFDWGMAAPAYAGTLTMPTTTAIASGTTAVSNVRDFTLSVNNNLTTDRFNMGQSGLKAKQVQGVREISGSITVEYTDDVLRDAHLGKTSAPLTVTMTSTESLSSGYSTFQIVLPQVWITGVMPKVNGGNLVTTTFSFDATYNGTDNPLTCCVRTADNAL